MRNAPKMYFSRLLIIFDITFIGVNILYHYKCLSSDTWNSWDSSPVLGRIGSFDLSSLKSDTSYRQRLLFCPFLAAGTGYLQSLQNGPIVHWLVMVHNVLGGHNCCTLMCGTKLLHISQSPPPPHQQLLPPHPSRPGKRRNIDIENKSSTSKI